MHGTAIFKSTLTSIDQVRANNNFVVEVDNQTYEKYQPKGTPCN